MVQQADREAMSLLPWVFARTTEYPLQLARFAAEEGAKKPRVSSARFAPLFRYGQLPARTKALHAEGHPG